MKQTRPILGITMGDPFGIGPDKDTKDLTLYGWLAKRQEKDNIEN